MIEFEYLPAEDRWQIEKRVGAALVYGIDVAGILTPAAVLSGTPTCVAGAGSGLTVGAVSFSGTQINAKISGGTAGAVVPITWSWVTAGGEADQRTVYLRIVAE